MPSMPDMLADGGEPCRFLPFSMQLDLPILTLLHRMEFVSCPGCKLNKLPEVKRFLKEVIEPGQYPGVTVNFIPGRLPEVRQDEDSSLASKVQNILSLLVQSGILL